MSLCVRYVSLTLIITVFWRRHDFSNTMYIELDCYNSLHIQQTVEVSQTHVFCAVVAVSLELYARASMASCSGSLRKGRTTCWEHNAPGMLKEENSNFFFAELYHF